ncbi:coiled-coil domain-containing protein 186 isoform X4 [Scophthalmus maximus]|uniref:coiled-coil domain-containing protein 186 isoform X4 n=1 Tax=Scophthalmus maximus TaxID=52904 RepID=UPI0015E0FA11|nr:coiled-coil domain-containing protein 186 isoform X4 [Scophthalmus maximus]
MRRFFRAQRDEDFSQIQYLTAKCTRLAHDKAALDREFLVSRERERRLQNDLGAAAARLLHQEQVNMELRMKQDQLTSRIHQQQDLVDLLRQRVALLVDESGRDAELLQQVGAELVCLQSSEEKLGGLVEELNAEAQHRAAAAESLQAELHAEARRRASLTEGLQAELRSKTGELEDQRGLNQTLRDELKDLSRAHQKEVRELQQENEGSLRKLQETAEQFEWLCQQQRYWMCCVKRFKHRLMEERDALLQQVSTLEKKAQKLRTCSRDHSPAQSPRCPLQDAESCDGVTSWDPDGVAELEVEKSSTLFEGIFHQVHTVYGWKQRSWCIGTFGGCGPGRGAVVR